MNEESHKIIEKLRSLKPYLQNELGIKRLRVFGSVARGEATPDSDVDLIADFENMPGLRFFSMYQDLGEKLERDVDLLTERALDKYLKNRILSEAQDVW